MMRSLVILLCAAGLAGSAEARPVAKTAPKTKAELLAAEAKAWSAVVPVARKHCAGCHTADGKDATPKRLAHLDITSRPVSTRHAKTVGPEIREVLGLTGKPPRMPFDNPGAVTGNELAAFKVWADAWDAADHAGAHADEPAPTH